MAIPIDPAFARRSSPAGRVLAMLLLLGSFGVAGLGVLFLSNATSGVGLLCFACLLAISARIAQASTHHSELRADLDQLRAKLIAPVAAPPAPAKPAPPISDLAASAKFYGVTNPGDRDTKNR